MICYPGLIGCRSMEDDSEIVMPESQTTAVSCKGSKDNEEASDSKQKKKVMTIGSTSIIPLKGSEVCNFITVETGIAPLFR